MDTAVDDSQTRASSPAPPEEPPVDAETPPESPVLEPADGPQHEEPPSNPPPPGLELEHAFWADIEEDRSTPDEAELREIESSPDGEHSALECMPGEIPRRVEPLEGCR